MKGATGSVVRYRRNLVPSATFFFTVALADRRSTGLIDHISTLRLAFRKARSERPFGIDAIVILPDHLHAIFTLPESDADFAHRWRRIKTVFTQGVLCAGEALGRRDGQAAAYGKGASGSTPSATTPTSASMSITVTTTRPGMDWRRARQIGRARRCPASFAKVSSRRIGMAPPSPAMSVANRGKAPRLRPA